MDLKKTFLKYVLASAVTLIAVHDVHAQYYCNFEEFTPRLQLKGHVGTSLFFGDIKHNPFFPALAPKSEWGFAAGISVEYQISHVFGVGLEGMYGKLKGNRPQWDVYFISDYFETNIYGTINFNNLFGKKRKKRFFSVYGLLGIGLVHYNTMARSLQTGEIVLSLGEGGGKSFKGRTLEGIAIYGLGFDFRLNDLSSIQFEIANRMMNSDKMDGWVNGYPYDFYNYASIGYVYKFKFKKKRKRSYPPVRHRAD